MGTSHLRDKFWKYTCVVKRTTWFTNNINAAKMLRANEDTNNLALRKGPLLLLIPNFWVKPWKQIPCCPTYWTCLPLHIVVFYWKDLKTYSSSWDTSTVLWQTYPVTAPTLKFTEVRLLGSSTPPHMSGSCLIMWETYKLTSGLPPSDHNSWWHDCDRV